MRIAATCGPEPALTQLEWIERAAAAGADGIVLHVAAFPRDDGEYLAQVRKIAVDLGLEVVAIDDPRLFDPAPDEDAVPRTLGIAAGCGAALVRTRLGPPGEVPPEAFASSVVRAKVLARTAKALNVTVAIEAAPGTLATTLAGVRHLVKDVDSAWLRYAAPALDPADGLGARDRIVLRTAEAADDPAALGRAVAAQSGPLALAAVPPEALAAWVKRLRQSTAEAVSITK